ncbi:unnamed protein product, partial [Symbiodinium natans]
MASAPWKLFSALAFAGAYGLWSNSSSTCDSEPNALLQHHRTAVEKADVFTFK